MKLYLTSNASLVMQEIAPKLPKAPVDLKVAFIPTAGDVYDETPWISEDRRKLLEIGFKVINVDLKNKKYDDLLPVFRGCDIIFVAGGNTFYLLEKAKASGFDVLAKKMVDEGKIYVGSSAGSVIAGPDIEAVAVFDDPEAGKLKNSTAFGLVDFVVLPHAGRDKYGSYYEKVLQEFSKKYKIIPIRDDQYIEVDDESYNLI